MKAFLLAAGEGTRLRPLTDRVPKCLVPIAGRPLLDYWLELLVRHHVDEVLINTHHLADEVTAYLTAQDRPLKVRLTFEATLLGSAGTVRHNWDFVERESDFLVLYADNLTDADLSELILQHRASGLDATIGLFHAERPSECGIVSLDDRGTVVGFEEKPANPVSDLAFAGIMVAGPRLWDVLPEHAPSDVGREVLPGLVGRMRGVELHYLRDVGTPESYRRAQHEALKLGAAS